MATSTLSLAAVAKNGPGDKPELPELTAAQRDALWNLGYVYLRHRQADKARTVFAALCALFPHQPAFALALAYAELLAGRPRQALAGLDRTRQQQPQQTALGGAEAVLRLLRGRALAALGRDDEARRELQHYLQARGLPARPSTQPGR